MRIVAIDLEGTGSQDGDGEDILEIALVPLTNDLEPDMTQAFSTLLDPQRPIPKRSWISPGITDTAVQGQPFLYQVSSDITRLVDGAYLLGHNVRVDWGLLSRKLPHLQVAGLLDTLRLARAHRGRTGNSLTALVGHYGLTADITTHVPTGQPHRALWDTVAAALLLTRLKADMKLDTLDQLTTAAAIPLTAGEPKATTETPTLFD